MWTWRLEMNGRSKKGYFNHWFIVCGVLGSSGLLITLLCNTAGMFVSPVMEQFGWSRTQATLYLTLFNWIAAAMQPIVGKIYAKYDMRLILSAVVIIFCGAYIWSGTFTSLWQWNLFGVIYGVMAGFFMYLPGPVLFSRWFVKKMSFAMSIGGIVSGIIGFFLNTLLVMAIMNMGWGKARMVLGAITLVACLFLTVFGVRNSPEQVGMEPYGAGEEVDDTKQEDEESGFTYKQVWRSPAFYLMLCYGFIIIILASFAQQIYSYADAMPIGMETAAKVFSVLSVAMLPLNPAIGWMYDKIGGIKGNLVICLSCTVGTLLLVLCGGSSKPLFYAGVAGYNLIMSSMGLGVPVLVKHVFGAKDYASILSKVTLVLLVSGGVANILYAQLYDITGTYATFPVMALVLSIVALVMVPLIAILAAGSRKKMGIR